MCVTLLHRVHPFCVIGESAGHICLHGLACRNSACEEKPPHSEPVSPKWVRSPAQCKPQRSPFNQMIFTIHPLIISLWLKKSKNIQIKTLTLGEKLVDQYSSYPFRSFSKSCKYHNRKGKFAKKELSLNQIFISLGRS